MLLLQDQNTDTMEEIQNTEPFSPPLPEKIQDSEDPEDSGSFSPPISQSKCKTPKRQKKCNIHSAVMQLHETAKLVADVPQDEYDKFGAHVAVQVRELPLRNFLIVQSKIQQIITEERLACLNAHLSQASVSTAPLTQINAPSTEIMSSSTGSTEISRRPSSAASSASTTSAPNSIYDQYQKYGTSNIIQMAFDGLEYFNIT